MNSYYTESELEAHGFAYYGKDVLISRNTYIFNPEEVVIGDNSKIDDYTVIIGKVEIGNHVHIAAWNYLNAGKNKIIIGDFSTLSGKCSVYALQDGIATYLDSNNIRSNMDVIIEKEVVFGMGSIILPGTIVKVGNSFGAMSIASGVYKEWGININYQGNKIAFRVKNRKQSLLLKEKAFLDEYEKR